MASLRSGHVTFVMFLISIYDVFQLSISCNFALNSSGPRTQTNKLINFMGKRCEANDGHIRFSNLPEPVNNWLYTQEVASLVFHSFPMELVR